MNSKPRLNMRLIGLCTVLCLSIGSYLTLHIMEARQSDVIEQEIMAEELESNESLPDVQLLKKLMHKTLEFMITTPRMHGGSYSR